MIDTLIAYRTDTPAPGLLRVRLRQWPMIALLVLMCVALMGIPLGFTVDILHGRHPFANLGGQPALVQAMAALGLAMLSMAGPAGLWLWPVHESLLLSQTDQRGWRITCNVFGRRRRVSDEFSLEGIRGLHLRKRKIKDYDFLEPVLVDKHGEPQALDFSSAMLKPGSVRAQNYLATLSAFFGKPWPEPVSDPQAWEQLMQKLKPRERAAKGRTASAAPRSSSPLSTPSSTDASSVAPPLSDPPPIALPLRITIGVVGVFFGMVALNNLFALISALGSGRLVTSGSRFSHSTHVARWADTPGWFTVNLLIESLGVLLLASITYGCLRVALRAPDAVRNRQAERESASATGERQT